MSPFEVVHFFTFPGSENELILDESKKRVIMSESGVLELQGVRIPYSVKEGRVLALNITEAVGPRLKDVMIRAFGGTMCRVTDFKDDTRSCTMNIYAPDENPVVLFPKTRHRDQIGLVFRERSKKVNIS